MMKTPVPGDRKGFHRRALELQRLREDPSEWNQEDVEFFADKLSELDPRAAENALFRVLRLCCCRGSEDNALRIVGILVRSSEHWRVCLAKSLRPKGRCPKRLRAKIRRLMSRPAIGSSVYLLDLQAEDLGIFRLGNLIDKLHAVAPDVTHVRVVFRGRVHPYGLAVLPAWLAQRGIVPEYAAENWTQRYLDSLGFLAASQMHAGAEPVYDSKNHMGLTAVSSSYRFDTDQTVGRFLKLFEEHLALGKEDQDALAIAIAELVENVHRHSHGRSPAFLVAQVHPTGHKLHIAIADCGIGVTASFQRGDNPEAKKAIRNDKDALVQACKPLVTSRLAGHAGYGLYVVSELAQRNGGTFVIASGDAILYKWGEFARWSGRVRPKEKMGMHQGWQGTIVGLMLDLTRRIPIDDVYNALPVPKGYIKEDFFE